MILGAIICFMLMLAGIEDDYTTMAIFFGGLCLLLIFLRVTKKSRAQAAAKARVEQREENAKKEYEERLKRAKLRFGNSSFVSLVLSELKHQNWEAVSNRSGCQVLKEKIVTPYKTYNYLDYGLGKLDVSGCKELATYLSSFYPGDCQLQEISHFVGSMGYGYSGYVTSDGNVSISRDADGHDVVDGYRIVKKISQSTAPQGKNW